MGWKIYWQAMFNETKLEIERIRPYKFVEGTKPKKSGTVHVDLD